MKYILNSIICFFLLGISVHSQIPDSTKYQNLYPKAFQKKLLEEKNFLLIDVREFFEFRKSRIKGAVNLPTMDGFDIAADTIAKEKALFFYCYSGGRSKKANLFFYEKGFRNLYNLKGGITQWKKDGLPVVRKKLKKEG